CSRIGGPVAGRNGMTTVGENYLARPAWLRYALVTAWAARGEILSCPFWIAARISATTGPAGAGRIVGELASRAAIDDWSRARVRNGLWTPWEPSGCPERFSPRSWALNRAPLACVSRVLLGGLVKSSSAGASFLIFARYPSSTGNGSSDRSPSLSIH